ncbi:MAG: HYR domain-containing protein [Bacteroidota bacterium]
MKRALPFLILFFSLSANPVLSQVFVDVNASGLNNGTSWTNAYTNLQSALINTSSGQIWVANGTYQPTTCNPCLDADRLISFDLPPGVQLYGGFAGNETLLSQRDWTTNLCILSGDIGIQNDSTDNTFRVVNIENSLTTTRLDGFIIEEGNADGSSINGTFFSGGGIYIDANPSGTGNVRIHNCTIRNNFAGGGGGMAVDAVIGGVIEADIRNCTFENNRASTGNVSSTGGAILMLGNSGAQIRPTIVDCTFNNNFVGNDGAAISMTPSGATSILETRISRCTFTNNESTDRGGAIWYRMIQGTSNVKINDCYFGNNIAGGQGGAVFARSSFDAIGNDTLLNCIFSQNQSTGTSSVNEGEGGAIFLRGSQTATRNHEILNCAFDRNFATHRGGAVGTTSFFDTPSDTIGTINADFVNCSFYGNITDGDGGAFHANGLQGTNNLTITNSILWGDTAMVSGMEILQVNSNVSIAFSNVSGGVPAGIADGGNNVDTEPFYNNPDNGDLRIGGCSPLVDAGNNAAVLSTQDPDPDGDQRIWDGIVDLGAYEVGIIYVDLTATGANNGDSWTDAFTDLQDGIDKAGGGDQIWVAEGIYSPTTCSGACTDTDRLISFLLKSGTELYGGFDGSETALSQRDWTTNFSILSGDIGTPVDSTDNTFRVVWAENTSAKTVFDGVIVEEGNADGSSINGTYFSGGGMYIDANPSGIGNLKIQNVTFRNNFAGGGGAMAIDAVIGGTIEAEIRDCVFEGNTASTGNVSSTGGAILMLGNSGATIRPTIIGCTFQNNFVGNDGAAISMTPSGSTSLLATKIDSCTFFNNESTDRGGAVWYRIIQGISAVKISNSTFQSNIAGGQGGGVFARASFDAVANDTIVNCIFSQNQSTGTSSVNDGEGGGLFMRGSQTATRTHQVLNCVFDRNFATHRGGAIGTTSFFDTPSDTIGTINSFLVNCSFFDNQTDGEGGAVHANGEQGTNNMTLLNSIFWNDSAGADGDELFNNSSNISLAYCDIDGGVPPGITDNGNNLDIDPKYLDPSNGNLRLEPCSPLIDIGDNAVVQAEQDPDPDGNSRIQNSTVDFGAYEFDGNPAVTAPMIITSDQTICPDITSISLSANTPANAGETGMWSVLSGAGNFNPSASSPNATVTGLSNGLNTFAWNITNSFCSFDDVSVDITLQDNTAPSANCQNITIQLDMSGNATISAADVDGGSTDDCNISNMMVSPNVFSNADLGNNTVTLTITDVGGNDDTCNATVNVVDQIMIACPSDISVGNDPGVCEAMVNIPQPTITNPPLPPITFTLINDYNNTNDASDDYFQGTTTVTWTYTESTGGMLSCQLTVMVEDTEAPQANCQNITVQLDGSGMAIISPTQIDNGSTDNCGSIAPAAMSLDQTTFNCNDVGDNTVTLTVNDDVDQTTTCTATVSVDEVSPPSAICQDITVQLDGMGNVTIDPSQVDDGSQDNCSGISLGLNQTAFNTGNIGSNTVVLTVTDANSNSATCSANIEVQNNNVPSAVCQDITVQLDASGMAAISATDIDGGSSAIGGIASLSVSPNDFSCLDTGNNTVTLTVTDNSGNTGDCTATVTVEDVIPPTVLCQDVTVQLDIAGNGMATAAQIDNGSTDNCGIASSTVTPNNFTCQNFGDTPVVYSVTDDSGNTSTCAAIVTVEDNIFPIAECMDITVQLDASGNYNLTPAEIDNGSSDNCPIAGLSVMPNSFNCQDIGTNTVTLSVSDDPSNLANCISQVTVQDIISPSAFCQDITIQLDGGGVANIVAADVDGGSTDNCSIQNLTISQTMFDANDLGTNTVTLTVTDANGNTATCFAQVEVDNSNPPIAVCQDITVQLDGAGTASISASDVDGGSSSSVGIQSLSIDINAFDCLNLGTNAVVLTVTDISGNTATCQSSVDVIDELSPMAACIDVTVQLTGSTETITSSQVESGSSDNCGVTLVTLSQSTFNCSDLGVNPITVTISDASSNESTCIANVTLEDLTPPDAICQDITVQLDGSGSTTINGFDLDGGSADNCTILTFAAVPDTYSCADIGTTASVLTVTDQSSNTGTCSANITIEDNLPPSAVCQDITVQLDGMGNAMVNAGQVDGGSTDNCGLQTTSVTPNTFDINDLGPNAVVLTVTDVNGNTATCSSNVEIQNLNLPNAVCQNATVQLDGTGNAFITAATIDGGSSAIGGIQSLSVTPDNFDCSNTGQNSVTLMVTDNSGNVATCSAIVTVEDNSQPTAICQDITIQLDGTGSASVTTGQIDNGSSDNCGIQSMSLSSDTFGCFEAGANNTTLTVTDDSGNTDSCEAIITVEDDSLPVALCQDITVQLDANGMAIVNASQVDNGSSDNCDSPILLLNPNSFDCSSIGANLVTLTVSDLAANTANCTATVTIEDGTTPNAVCQDITIQLGGGMATITPGQVDGGSTDNCTIQTMTVNPNSFNLGNLGPNTVFLTVTDGEGSTDICSAIVEVQNNNVPNAVCQNISVQLDASGIATFTAAEVDGGSSANAGIQSMTIVPDNFNCQDVGPNNVTLTVVDNLGSSASCTSIVTVEDTLPPTAICQDITIQLDGIGMASISSGQVDSGSTDNCGVQSIAVTPDNFDINDIGSNTVELTVTDFNGNSATCSANVEVENNNLPNAVCQDITVELDLNGSASISANDVDGGSTANAGIQSLSVFPDDFLCFDVGQTNVTLTIVDNLGNSATCTAIVTVEDNLPPNAVCLDTTVQLDGMGNATIIDAQVNGGSTDNCGIQFMSVSPNTFDINDIGSNTVILTLTDVNGNTSTCSANVEVENTNAPTAVCQDITVQLDASGMAAISAADVDGGSSSGAGIQSISVVPENFDCQNEGQNTVTLTVIDNLGAPASCTAVVTVEDNLPPTAICQDITVQLDGTGMASISTGQLDGGSTDNCDIQTVSASQTDFDINDIGVNPIVLTVTDVNANTATCNANVDIQNTGLPNAFCQDITVQLDASGVATIDGTDVDGGSTVSSGDIHLFADPNSFDCSHLGANLVTLCVVDDMGQSATCQSTVTVVDLIAPTCEAQDISVTIDMNGMAAIDPMALVVQPGQLDFSDSGQLLGAESTNECLLFDFDNDGDLDAFFANENQINFDPFNSVYLNDGAGNFTASGVNFGPALVRAVDAADIDGDGDIDIVMSSTFGEANSYFNDGAGNFTAGTNFISSFNTINLAIGDLNGDCAPDVFVGNGGTTPNTVKFNNGDGTFTDSGQSLGIGTSWTVELGDVDNDGDLDAVVANTNGEDKVWINDGNGMFTDNGQSLYADQSTGLRLGDLDGDNDLDYFLTTNNILQPSLVYLNDGSGNFTGTGQNIGQSNGTDLELADFDKDGDLDAFVVNIGQPDTVWINDGNAIFTAHTTTFPLDFSFSAASGDVDDDGDIDILEGHFTGGNPNLVYLNTFAGTGTMDNCSLFGDLVFSVDPPAFGCDEVDTTQPVVLTVTDASGNSSMCTAMVTVNGPAPPICFQQPPIAVCQDITVQLDASGMVSITAADVDGGSTADNGIQSMMVSPESFDCMDIGVNLVVLTVTDNLGETSTCEAQVLVEDDELPAVICQNITVQLDNTGSVTVDPDQLDNGSTDNCGIVNMTLPQNTFDCNQSGDNTVILLVEDQGGNIGTCGAVITVEDASPPTALCMDFTVQLDGTGMAMISPTDVDAGSSDNCGIQSIFVVPSAFTVTDIGANTVTLTVIDDSNNTSTCTATTTVENNNAPIAICQDINIELDASGTVSILASDVDGGSSAVGGIQSITVSPDTFTCMDIGDNLVTLTISDISGNQSTCAATVTIEDNESPNAICQDITVQLGATGNVSIAATQIDNGSSDNCGIAGMVLSQVDFTCNDIGPNSTSLTVSDPDGNQSACSANVTVEDNLPPIALCQDITVQLNASGNVGIAASQIDNGSSDNCGITSMIVSPSNFTCTELGDNPATLTISDVAGNTTNCASTVTVEDNSMPTIICPANIIAGNCATVTSVPIPSVSSLCGNFTLMNDFNGSGDASGVYPIGLTTVTWTVSESNGNLATCSMTVEIVNALQVAVSSTLVSCTGGSDGTATAIVGGGNSPYTFNWSNGQTDMIATGLSAGPISVTITDFSGCQSTAETMISENAPLNITLDITAPACFDECTGVVQAIVLGGTPGYSYEWSTGQTGVIVAGLCDGDYSLSVTDALGCTQNISFTVDEPTPIDLNPASINGICTASAGTASVTPSGGTGDYTYLWNTGATDNQITGLLPGQYDITVTDENGCEETTSMQIDVLGNISPVLDISDITCFGANDGSIIVLNPGDFSYTWSNGSTMNSATGLSAGEYTVTMVDNISGCTGMMSATIEEAPPLMSDILTFDSQCSESSGSASVIVSGGVSPYSYLWSNGETTTTINNLFSGNYSVTITDADGCTEENIAFVTSEDNGPVLDVFSVNVSCAGANDGSIDVTIVGGAMPFTYSWTDGPEVEDRNGLGPGIYTLLVNDANGCFAATSVVISQAGALTLDTGSTPSSGDDGSAFVTIFGGVSPFTYQWSNGGTGPIIEDLAPGTYTVSVTDANGCTGQAEVVVPLFTNIEELESLEQFEIYPNPTSGLVNIEITFDRPLAFWLSVYNVLGQKIEQTTETRSVFNTRFDLTSYRSGIYFISLETEEGIAVRQVFVVE